MAIVTFKYFLIQTELREVRYILSSKLLNCYNILTTFAFKDTVELKSALAKSSHNHRAGNVYSGDHQCGLVPANEMPLSSVAR